MTEVYAGSGGLAIVGATDGILGLMLSGNTNLVNTTKTTAASGAVYILGAGRSGTSRTELSANANILVVANNGL